MVGEGAIGGTESAARLVGEGGVEGDDAAERVAVMRGRTVQQRAKGSEDVLIVEAKSDLSDRRAALSFEISAQCDEGGVASVCRAGEVDPDGEDGGAQAADGRW
jgi:hypothetical protein